MAAAVVKVFMYQHLVFQKVRSHVLFENVLVHILFWCGLQVDINLLSGILLLSHAHIYKNVGTSVL